MNDITQQHSWRQRLRLKWQQRFFLRRHLSKYLHPQLATLFFNSLFDSHRFIQTAFIKRRALADLPLCLVIGATHSGKSSLIQQVGPKHVEGLNSRYQPMAARSMPQFSLTPHKLWLELPTYLLINESTKHIPYLQQWLDFFKTYGYLAKTREIIYTLSLDSLLNPNEDQLKQLDEFFASLALLLSHLPHPVNIHLVITKVDRILGFSEFFDDLSFEERQLPCGIVLSNQQLNHTFKKQFHHLVRRLTERLFWRCHSEHQWQRRLLVADFPQQFLQLEKSLAAPLTRFEELLPATPQARLKSLYCVSLGQQGKLIDLLGGQNLEVLHAPSLPSLPLLLQRKTFFVRGFLQHLSHSVGEKTKIASKKPRASWPKWRASKKWWALLLLPLFAVGSYAIYDYHLSAIALQGLEQDGQLTYTLITANDPKAALQAYILHMVPHLSQAKQRALIDDPKVRQQLLDTAYTYVNHTWQEQVVRFYQQHIDGLYPIDTHGQKEVALDKFTALYGPQGLIVHFQHTYLAPLEHQGALKLKPDGERLLQTTARLHSLLFDTSGQPQIRFSLSLSSMAADIRQVDFGVNGSQLSARPHSIINKSFNWPNPASLPQSGYAIQKRNGLPTAVVYPGEWSWLKVFQQSQLLDFHRADSGGYEGSLNLADGSVQFTLSSNQDLTALLPLFAHLTVPTKIL